MKKVGYVFLLGVLLTFMALVHGQILLISYHLQAIFLPSPEPIPTDARETRLFYKPQSRMKY